MNNNRNLGKKQSYSWFSGFSRAFIGHRGTNSLRWDLSSKTSRRTMARLSNWHSKDLKRFGILLSSCSLARKKIIDLSEIQGPVSWDVKWHHNDRYSSFSPQNYAITLSGILTITREGKPLRVKMDYEISWDRFDKFHLLSEAQNWFWSLR
jgi:hypothetical protein